MPNGRACTDFRNRTSTVLGGQIVMTDNVRGFYKFDKELRKDLIPAVEGAYSVVEGRAGRALAGLSMGGMQAVNFGSSMAELFTSVGAFSCGPTTKTGEEVIGAIRAGGVPLDELCLICGEDDVLSYPCYTALSEALASAGEDVIKHLTLASVPGGKHDFAVWNYGLEVFLRAVFLSK